MFCILFIYYNYVILLNYQDKIKYLYDIRTLIMDYRITSINLTKICHKSKFIYNLIL